MKPIETEYGGVKFRSRTETRWAMVFDALGIEWLYEPEGFDLPEVGRYVPDFYLPGIGCWFEVKGKAPTEEEEAKGMALAAASQKPVMIASGYVTPTLATNLYGSESKIQCCIPHGPGGGAWVDERFALCRCPKCGRYGIEFDGEEERIQCRCDLGPVCHVLKSKDPTIIAAYEKAERNRFWDPPAPAPAPAPEPKAPRSRVLESLNRMCKNERAKSFAAKRTHLTPK